MSAPVVATVGSGSTASNQTSHTITMPASIAAGDLLLLFFTNGTFSTVTASAGWTQVFKDVSNTPGFAVYSKVAAGGDTATITTGTTSSSAHACYRITGSETSTTPEAGAISTIGTNTTIDFPIVTPSWGANFALWFAFGASQGSATVNSYPTNYSNGLRVAGVGAGADCVLAMSYRTNSATSENPDSLTWSTSQQSGGVTIGVKALPITVTVSETVTGSETVSAQRSAVLSVSETVTGTETVNARKGKVVSVVETVTGTDTNSFALKWTRQAKNTSTFTNDTKH